MRRKMRKVNRSTTDRLKRLIEAELDRQSLTDEEAAREARLPGNAFRALRKGHRPSIDRAEELCTALGISMMIGPEAPTTASEPGAQRARADAGTVRGGRTATGGQGEPAGPSFAGVRAFASTTPTSHSASYQVSVSPAACALRGASPATTPAA